jgi:hypothetical protein
MQYVAEPSKVVYRAKNGTEEKVFDALGWLAAMCSHIPERGEQMVRYYGFQTSSTEPLNLATPPPPPAPPVQWLLSGPPHPR